MNNKSAVCNPRILFAALSLTAFAAFGGEGNEGGYDAPYFQADFTQDLNSWTSALVNPALLFRVNQMHASMAFYRWGLDNRGGNVGYQDFSLFYPYRYRHTFGLTVLHANNKMQRTYIDRNSPTDEVKTQGSVAYQDLWAIGNYGLKVLPWFWGGANVKVRTQSQFGNNAVSEIPGLDIGLYFNPIDHYRIGDIGISLMAQDIVPTQTPWKYDWGEDAAAPDFSSESGSVITASRGRAGLRYAGLNDNLVVSAEVLVDNAFRDFLSAIRGKEFQKQFVSGGMSLDEAKDRVKTLSPIVPRYGFHVKYMFIPQIWFKGGLTNNEIPYLGFNYNVFYPLPEMLNIFNLDFNFGYSFIDNAASMQDERGMVMMTKASVDFGRTREQKESKRLYDKLVVAPMDVYQEAMRLYTAGKYWEAAFAYGKLMSLYPTFYLNDKAVYYMGDSYKNLYMNNTAREVFKEALDEYTTSDMRAFYLYGIMSLDYREENYDEAMRNYSFIINLYPETEIRGEAEYLAGEIEFLRGHYDEARAHLEAVKPSDPSYLNALFTLAVINYQTDRHQASVQNLKAVVDGASSSAPDVILQNAAAVKLGHTYFEMGDKLREAVEAYGLVREDASPHGDEALLGTTWSWIKAGQPQIALQKADRLIQLHPQSPFVPEAHLLRGYALMLMKRHADAIPAFERALAACGDNKFLTDEDVKMRKVQNDKSADDFAPEADKIKKNAMRKPTPRSVEERADLYKSYESFSAENKEFFHYRVTAKSHNNFHMRKEDIVEDATFALAKATNYIKSRGTASEVEKMRKGEEKLDAEIEKLRQQLDNAD